MAIRFDDAQRTVSLSVRDLAADGAASGHLALAVVRSRGARAAAGRQVHQDWQLERADQSATYRAELTVRRTLAVGEWTANLLGRIDGVDREDDRYVVEEVKSTPLDASRLYRTRAEDWPAWLAQLEIYLWMLADQAPAEALPLGRLVLVSLADGSRHVLGVALEADRVEDRVRRQIEALVAARERRIAWMSARRGREVPIPHVGWRDGQREIAEAVEWGLEAGHPVLVQAPTGLGKTDAALVGVLKLALRTDRQVFWATARNTQQAGVLAAVGRLRAAGLPLRAVQIGARERLCLNGVVDCRPDACTYADGYFERLDASGVVPTVTAEEAAIPADRLRALGQDHRLCPFELGVALAGAVDLVVGDYNHALDPSVRLQALEEDGAGWIVVADEVHQLVDRARDWVSPRLEAAVARAVAHQLWAAGPAFAPFVRVAERVEQLVVAVAGGPAARRSEDQAVVALPEDEIRALCAAVDDIGIDYALLRADQPPVVGGEDPWLVLARQVLRLGAALDALDDSDEHTIAVARTAAGDERVGLLCLDPSRALGERIARLGGFVGLSATLRPTAFYRDLLGLDPERTDAVEVGSPFPAERRRVLVAPRISTAFRDRAQHAGPTAALISRCVAAVPGNVAVYFPSFAMLDDIVGRIRETFPPASREWLVQARGMDEALRGEALGRLSAEGPPKVLCAVLGGVFAEGIDLPPGALAGVLVVGPALPPIGLERDLLREHYEARFGEGFRLASLVPGLTRVVQAAGRLIRRPEDRGVVVLMDRRFRWRDVRALLPEAWAPEVVSEPAIEIARFFEATPPPGL
jgi:DNA excision repair protein ERCC-2